jgi:hypothetical protein
MAEGRAGVEGWKARSLERLVLLQESTFWEVVENRQTENCRPQTEDLSQNGRIHAKFMTKFQKSGDKIYLCG